MSRVEATIRDDEREFVVEHEDPVTAARVLRALIYDSDRPIAEDPRDEDGCFPSDRNVFEELDEELRSGNF